MEKVLVTGGAGFGGSGLVRRLLEDDREVVIVDATAPLHADRILDLLDNPGLTYLWKAVQDLTIDDIEGCDVVVHLAAQADVPMGLSSPEYTVLQNVGATVHLLETARHVHSLERFVYAGSGNEWGRPLYLPIDEDHPLTPHNPYAFSKAAAELACWAWHRCYGVPVTIMSNGVVIGPGMRRNIFIFMWLWNMFRGKPIVVEGGQQTRDVTYVDDVLDAWMLALSAPGPDVVGQKFQVSYGEERSVEQLASLCMDVTGLRVPIIFGPYRPGEEGQRESFSNEKARAVLGYKPEVAVREAIWRTADWMRCTWFPGVAIRVRLGMVSVA